MTPDTCTLPVPTQFRFWINGATEFTTSTSKTCANRCWTGFMLVTEAFSMGLRPVSTRSRVTPEGCIDFQAITDKLKAMDYRGWIVVEAEQDPAKAPPFDYSKIGYDHIVKICGCSGLTIAH